ncbi:MAG: cytochrome c-type biogenesis protein [Bellilinea sp.]
MNSAKKKPLPFPLFALIIGLFLVGVSFFSAQAQSPTPSDNEVNKVAKELYCPVCENISLDVCPTQACAQWRALIREKLAAGWSDEQIKDYFVAQYGDRVLSTPPTRGLNWLVYILPPLIFLGGVYLVYRVLRSMKNKKPAPITPLTTEPGQTDPYLSQLEAELEQHRKHGE